MGTDLEVAIFQSSCRTDDKQELYWLFSRTQLEFILKELELLEGPGAQVVARYQEMILPVLSLEEYFGFSKVVQRENLKYLVLRAVDEKGNMRRIIVETEYSPKFFDLTKSFSSLESFVSPQKNTHISGAYSLGTGKVGVVPDVANICLDLV
ncbi:MAG: hypothetical protein ACI8ZB_000643 [Desulforhopalus sp.]|jgi:hypothetical protein